jgi:hypothetical protein
MSTNSNDREYLLDEELSAFSKGYYTNVVETRIFDYITFVLIIQWFDEIKKRCRTIMFL